MVVVADISACFLFNWFAKGSMGSPILFPVGGGVADSVSLEFSN